MDSHNRKNNKNLWFGLLHCVKRMWGDWWHQKSEPWKVINRKCAFNVDVDYGYQLMSPRLVQQNGYVIDNLSNENVCVWGCSFYCVRLPNDVTHFWHCVKSADDVYLMFDESGLYENYCSGFTWALCPPHCMFDYAYNGSSPVFSWLPWIDDDCFRHILQLSCDFLHKLILTAFKFDFYSTMMIQLYKQPLSHWMFRSFTKLSFQN